MRQRGLELPAFKPPWWLARPTLISGHTQTLWSPLYARRTAGPKPVFRRERWHTPDGDFVDADWLDTPSQAPENAPLLVLFHGLEGSSNSHYAQAFADTCRRHGWRLVVPHFRGCSGTLNHGPRAYHSGDHEEVGWMLSQCRQAHAGPLWAAGVSLGGNALLRWAQEAGTSAASQVKGVAAISAPLDLTISGHALGQGFNRQVYNRIFLRTMKPKALRKLEQYPGLFDRQALLASRDLYEFDNVFTAPLHGFKNTDDYWRRASAKPHLRDMALPTLVLNALNDPFVPPAALPQPHEVGPWVTLWQPAQGGHVGFPSGAWPAHVLALPESVLDWMSAHG